MTKEIETILRKLESSPCQVDQVNVSGSGVYALFLDCPLEFVPAGLAYIGCSCDLSKRLIEQHFKAGRTPQSSLRRSLGALLKEKLNLKLVPERLGGGKFRFVDEDEKRLSEWMRQHIRVGTRNVMNGFEAVERCIIPAREPILNLTHWENPRRKEIKQLRQVMCKG